MKLASYQDGSRDGQLVVVDRHLKTACYATAVASKLQQVLDDWNFLSPQLQDIYDALNQGRARHSFPFNPLMCLAPLPRAYQCISAQAWLNHEQTVDQATTNVPLTENLSTLPPRTTQTSSDWLHGACATVAYTGSDAELDFEAGIAAITGDVAHNASPEQALESVRLLALSNCMVVRKQATVSKQQEFLLQQPFIAFSPVAITPDELGDLWRDGRVHLTLQVSVNGRNIGLCEMAADMDWGLHQIIAHACRMRPLRAGSIMHAAPVSNKDPQKGFASLLEKRASEQLQYGLANTNFLNAGDIVRVSAVDKQGASLFGSLEQTCLDANEPQNRL